MTTLDLVGLLLTLLTSASQVAGRLNQAALLQGWAIGRRMPAWWALGF